LGLALALVRGLGPEGLVENAGVGYPWVACAATLLLALFFHRSRVAVLALALAALQFVTSGLTGGYTTFYFTGGLFALFVLGVSPLQDRGLFSTAGALQFGGMAVLGFFGALFVSVAPGDIAVFLAAMPLPAHLTIWSGFPQPVFLAFLLAILTTLGVALFRDGPVERGLFWAAVTVAVGLYHATDPAAVSLFNLAAGLTLGLSVVATSYAMAYRDDLTALPARRALMRDLDGLGGTFTAAMVDVDHFKKFNDKYGHDVGDQVLKMVAVQLAQARGGCRAYRFGGEEFTLLYAGKTCQDALPFLEDVRRSVEDAAFTLRSWKRPRKKPVDPGGWKSTRGQETKRLSVTVSIGVADSTGKDPTPEAVLKKADQALYRAKKGGRNRVAK
jgi:GGDEF domain-containing protein